jgi:hypothetical protein
MSAARLMTQWEIRIFEAGIKEGMRKAAEIAEREGVASVCDMILDEMGRKIAKLDPTPLPFADPEPRR